MGKAEVDKFDVVSPPALHDDVVGLDVEVHNASVVQILYRV